MKTDIYGTHAMWMQIYYLIKVSQPVCKINVTYPHFAEGKTELRDFALAQAYVAGKWQNQPLNPGVSSPKSKTVHLYYIIVQLNAAQVQLNAAEVQLNAGSS